MSRVTRKNRTNKIYSNVEYNSNDGMLTTVWGPGIWHYLHTMSFNYPVKPTAEDKRHYRDFVLSLKYVLPCGKCRKNLTKNFKRLPLTMDSMKSRATFSKYIYDLHETVNRMLDKKSGLSYDDVRERYEHFRARCVQPEEKLHLEKMDGGKNKRTRGKKTLKKSNKADKVAKAVAKANAKAVAKADEKGCVIPLYGEKARCILQIVPQEVKSDTIQIDGRCIKKRILPQ